MAPPVPGPDGALYGLTEGGGAYYGGTAYELRPPASPGGPWTETVLYSFDSLVGQESYPFSLTVGPGGRPYGTAESGATAAGNVFELAPPSSEENA
jgi:hypothetical protein